MNHYFDFSKNDGKVFIPKAKSSMPKQKGGFINHNRISVIKSAPSLDKYAKLTERKEDK